MRILLSILISIAPILGYAQTTGKVLEANAALGIQSVPNYVVNSNAEKNTNSILQSGGTLSRDCSGPEVIDGTCSFDWISDTSGQYLKFTANPINAGKLGANCAAYVRYQLDTLGAAASTYIVVEDGSGNAISPQVALSNTYNSVAAANAGNMLLAIIPGYPCKPSQENRFAIYRSASTSSRIHFDEVHVIDYPNPTSVPQGSSLIGYMTQTGAAGCTYNETTSSGLTNFVALGTGSGCNAWSAFGLVTATGTNDHRPVVARIEPNTLVSVSVKGAFSNLAAGNCFWRLSDGTNTYNPQAQNNNAVGTMPALTFKIPYTTAQTNVTYTLQAADDQASGCRYGDASTSSQQSWFFEQTPLTGSSNTIVPASCINNPDCQNSFSAKVSSAGVVSDEDYSFINGNASISATSTYALTWDTNRFSVAPNCTATIANSATAVIFQEITTSTTGVSIRILASTTGANLAASFHIRCSRAGTDVKPWGPIPWLTGMVSSNSTSSLKMEYAIMTTGTCTPSKTSSSWITGSGTNMGTTCTFTMSGFSDTPSCTCTALNQNAACYGASGTWNSTTLTLRTLNSSTFANLDSVANIICIGPR